MRVVLAGYVPNDDELLKNKISHLGYDIKTYNKIPGMADFHTTDVLELADILVNLTEHQGLHNLLCRYAGESSADVRVRPPVQGMQKIVLAGYDTRKQEDEDIRRKLYDQGNRVFNYNKDIECGACKIMPAKFDSIVFMADYESNPVFYQWCASLAAKNFAELRKVTILEQPWL